MSTVEIQQRFLGLHPYILIELNSDGDGAEIEMGGNPTSDEAKTLLKFVRRSIKPLKRAVKESLAEQNE